MIIVTLIFTLIACYGAFPFLILGIVITKKQTEEKLKILEQYYEEKRWEMGMQEFIIELAGITASQ